MAEHNIIGQKGEEIACETMRKKGFRVVDTNWKFGHLEMDVIAVSKKEIAFVEVKTRRESVQAPPQESVDWRKQQRIVRAAQNFLKSGKGKPYGSHECMFDVVAVTFCGDEHITEWIPQAFIPLYR